MTPSAAFQKMLKRRGDFGYVFPGKPEDTIPHAVLNPMGEDLMSHGYIALKEAGISDKKHHNMVASSIASYRMKFTTFDQTSFDPVDLFELRKKLQWAQVRHNLPLLIVLFASPQPVLYEKFMATTPGAKLMEWLSIGADGAYDLEMLVNQSADRFAQLTEELLVSRLRGKGSHADWYDYPIRALGVLNHQHYLCEGKNPDSVRQAIGKRLYTFNNACGLGQDGPIQTLLDTAVFPYPEYWEKLSIEPQEFLGFPELFDDIPGVIRDTSWGGSALCYYTSSQFMGVIGKTIASGPIACKTLKTYLAKLRRSGLDADYLRSQGMASLMDVRHPFPCSYTKQYGEIFKHKAQQDKALPSFNNPITRLYLESDLPDRLAYLQMYFDNALKSDVPANKAAETLTVIRRLSPEMFDSHMASTLGGQPSGSAMKKLYPFMANPHDYVSKMPESLQAEQLERDLGL